MMNEPPVGKVQRALSGSGTAAKVGGKMLLHYAKRPFMGTDKRCLAREQAIRESAETLFKGLSLLKGTALKLAQQLSLELDMIPEAACRELAKSYHQVPPINRALVRQAVQSGLGKPPESLFQYFDMTAFAAASLGQVHAAIDKDNMRLAVKIQYPGIAKTIDNDITLLRRMLSPIIQRDQLLPMLDEVSARLHEEVNYRKEADNVLFFGRHLNIPRVRISEVRSELSAGTVLTTSRMPGKPLDQWLADKPDHFAVDRVAQTLQDIFTKGVYELGVIHADPNPGNFIIDEDLTVGLVDFGCVKHLSPDFVEQYRRLAMAANHRKAGEHFEEMIKLGFIAHNLRDDVLREIQTVSATIGCWFGRLCENEVFDFKAHPDFIAQGKEAMGRFHHLRRYVKINPDFLFLDRTRYGLLRLFEQMGAMVRFRNPYEWGDKVPA